MKKQNDRRKRDVEFEKSKRRETFRNPTTKKTYSSATSRHVRPSERDGTEVSKLSRKTAGRDKTNSQSHNGHALETTKDEADQLAFPQI